MYTILCVGIVYCMSGCVCDTTEVSPSHTVSGETKRQWKTESESVSKESKETLRLQSHFDCKVWLSWLSGITVKSRVQAAPYWPSSSTVSLWMNGIWCACAGSWGQCSALHNQGSDTRTASAQTRTRTHTTVNNVTKPTTSSFGFQCVSVCHLIWFI